MTAYYNEINPFAAQWLRNLIDAGEIAPGIVDERSIEDVTANDLRGFIQCHFFAGIGVWSHALRSAGWPDNRPVWTASCPCQPFSKAGKGNGFADERHLWPSLYHLFSQCKPNVCFGEQVAGVNEWFDLVQADVEGMGYTFGLVPFTAASFGAPNIRDRAYWVADSGSQQHEKSLPGLAEDSCEKSSRATVKSSGFCLPSRVDNAQCERLYAGRFGDNSWHDGQQPDTANKNGRMECASSVGLEGGVSGRPDQERGAIHGSAGCDSAAGTGMPMDGFWRAADWLGCRDGKWRPVEPGTFPLVAGVASELGRGKSTLGGMARGNRKGRLEGYGNALNAVAATAFINAFINVGVSVSND